MKADAASVFLRPPSAPAPAVRLLCLLVLAAALPGLRLPVLAGLALLLLLIHLRLGRAALARLWMGVKRLRWLWFALLVLYIGMTPGPALTPLLPGLSTAGLAEAARRGLILFVLLAAVYWLTTVTAVTALAGGLLWLLRPLTLFGIDPDRLALRIALSLQAVTEAEQRLRGLRADGGSLIDAAAHAVVLTEATALAAEPTPVVVTRLPAPAPAQWLWPLLLGLLLFGFGR